MATPVSLRTPSPSSVRGFHPQDHLMVQKAAGAPASTAKFQAYRREEKEVGVGGMEGQKVLQLHSVP